MKEQSRKNVPIIRSQSDDTLRNLGTEERTVFVRQLLPTDALWSQIEDQLDDTDQDVFAVMSATGEPLAVVSDRAAAFVGARRNDFVPVSAH